MLGYSPSINPYRIMSKLSLGESRFSSSYYRKRLPSGKQLPDNGRQFPYCKFATPQFGSHQKARDNLSDLFPVETPRPGNELLKAPGELSTEDEDSLRLGKIIHRNRRNYATTIILFSFLNLAVTGCDRTSRSNDAATLKIERKIEDKFLKEKGSDILKKLFQSDLDLENGHELIKRKWEDLLYLAQEDENEALRKVLVRTIDPQRPDTLLALMALEDPSLFFILMEGEIQLERRLWDFQKSIGETQLGLKLGIVLELIRRGERGWGLAFVGFLERPEDYNYYDETINKLLEMIKAPGRDWYLTKTLANEGELRGWEPPDFAREQAQAQAQKKIDLMLVTNRELKTEVDLAEAALTSLETMLQGARATGLGILELEKIAYFLFSIESPRACIVEPEPSLNHPLP